MYDIREKKVRENVSQYIRRVNHENETAEKKIKSRVEKTVVGLVGVGITTVGLFSTIMDSL
jgi:hypothetical protein